MTSHLPREDRNQFVLRELDVFLIMTKGTLQIGNTPPDGD